MALDETTGPIILKFGMLANLAIWLQLRFFWPAARPRGDRWETAWQPRARRWVKW